MELDFLPLNQINITLANKEFFNQTIGHAIVVFGILSNIIFLPFCIVAPKIAAKQFKELYPNEEILYIVKNPPISRFIVFFLLGAFFAICIYPFIIFENLNSYLKIHRSFFWLYVIIFIIVSHGLICFRYSLTYILSDTCIRALMPYKFSSIYKGKYYGAPLFYSTIESVEQFRILTTVYLEIKLKKGYKYLEKTGFLGLCAFDKLGCVRKIIEDKIKKEE